MAETITTWLGMVITGALASTMIIVLVVGIIMLIKALKKW